MKFSVIVPVYKVEAYLPECMESILSQSFGDFEVILVDDGSPDQCPAICDAYAERDSRVRVIHQANGGVSAARNNGLFSARGEYIVFVDSDDILCEKSLAEIYKNILEYGDSDIVIGNITYWDEARGKERTFDYKRDFESRPADKTLLELNEVYARQHLQLPWPAYHSVYNRTFLSEQHLYFKEGLVCAEDLDFYLQVIRTAGSYILTDVSLVKYRLNRAGSVITAPTLWSVWGKLAVFSDAYEQAGMFSDEALMRSYFADYFAHGVLDIAQLSRPADRERCYRFVRENRHILREMSLRPRYLAARIVWGLLGLEAGTCLLMKSRSVYKRRI